MLFLKIRVRDLINSRRGILVIYFGNEQNRLGK